MNKEQFINLCQDKLRDLNLGEDYEKRLKEELKEIESQDCYGYFSELMGIKKDNENNLLVPYLLGICDSVNIKQPPLYDQGDSPDQDIDYDPIVRDYLKEQYVKKEFSEEKICGIATYTTFKLRNALIDMAKVFDLDRKEILALTTKLGIKDDEGNPLTFDKAVELYPELKAYLEKHPDMADATRRILHRNRNMGVHASGLIISNVSINEFVPLVRGKNNQPCSAWVEGLYGTDLGAVGLVKFDFLSLDGNTKIAQALRLIGKKVCALPGKSNWTDLRYLNDPVALEMANKGDLKMIFQYDGSEGIRRLAREGGISSFDDLAIYTALYRPACIQVGMHEAFCKRKRGEVAYDIHPILEPYLKSTFNILVFQEQTLHILNVVGKIPMKDCEEVRKAISKKKIEKFKKYKDIFVTNGQITLGYSKEKVEEIWNNIEAFAGYGFNQCLHGDTLVSISGSKPTKIKDLLVGNQVDCLSAKSKIINQIATHLHSNGTKKILEITTYLGKKIKATPEHRFLTFDGWKTLTELQIGDRIASPRKLSCGNIIHDEEKILATALLLTEGNTCHPSTLYFTNQNEQLLKSFEEYALKFNNTKTRREYRDGKTTNVAANTGSRNGRLGKSGIYRWAESIGLTFKKATQKHLPDFAWELPENQLSQFLGAMWSCDGHLGCLNKHSVFYATSSERLADELQLIHLRLGVVLLKRTKKFRYRGGIKIGYALYLIGSESYHNFVTNIGPYCIGRQEEAEYLKSFEYKDFKDLLPKEVLSVIKSESPYATLWETAKKCNLSPETLRMNVKKKVGFRRSTILAIANSLNSNKLKEIANSDIFWDKIKTIKDAGETEVYDITVENDHNYVANGLITHNSHCTAYSYISARMLYLKAHYPLEFYTSFLNCTESTGEKDYLKVKDYKQEAIRHGIPVNRVDINISKSATTAHNKEIYWGFSKIKGIGEESAQNMEKHQPYADYKDFLARCSIEAKINNAVIALRLFPGDPLDNYNFYCRYKVESKKLATKTERYNNCLRDYTEELNYLCGEKEVTEENILQCIIKYPMCQKELRKLLKKLQKTTETYNKPIVVPETEIKEDYLALLKDTEAAEKAYYGFVWDHPLEKCAHYKGFTYEQFVINNTAVGPVDVLIRNCKLTKGPKATYYRVETEDSNHTVRHVTVWQNDYNAFSELIKKDNCVRMSLEGPSKGFTTYTLARRKKWDKSYDTRIISIK